MVSADRHESRCKARHIRVPTLGESDVFPEERRATHDGRQRQSRVLLFNVSRLSGHHNGGDKTNVDEHPRLQGVSDRACHAYFLHNG